MKVFAIIASNDYHNSDRDYRTKKYVIVAETEEKARELFTNNAHWVFDTFEYIEEIDTSQEGVYL